MYMKAPWRRLLLEFRSRRSVVCCCTFHQLINVPISSKKLHNASNEILSQEVNYSLGASCLFQRLKDKLADFHLPRGLPARESPSLRASFFIFWPCQTKRERLGTSRTVWIEQILSRKHEKILLECQSNPHEKILIIFISTKHLNRTVKG